MIAIIDRFEGGFAICQKENKELLKIETNKLPKGSKEGDALKISFSGIIIDKERTENLREEIKDLTKNLWE
ncbi:MAG: DUF3006 domain-containing protein [Clostridia bacterium]